MTNISFYRETSAVSHTTLSTSDRNISNNDKYDVWDKLCFLLCNIFYDLPAIKHWHIKIKITPHNVGPGASTF